MSYISNYGEFIGILIWFLGGIDNLLLSLMIFVTIECLTSALCFLSLYQFSIKSIVRWIANKFTIFLLIGIANTIDTFLIQSGESLRTIALWFYISYECIIVLDNSKNLAYLFQKNLLILYMEFWRSLGTENMMINFSYRLHISKIQPPIWLIIIGWLYYGWAWCSPLPAESFHWRWNIMQISA